MEREAGSWFPLFEFQDYSYQSFLLSPSAEQDPAKSVAVINAKEWANGALLCGQAFDTGGGYRLDGTLSFRPGVELAVSAKGAFGKGDAPATFEATGTGVDGPLKGTIYELVGWVFPELPIANAAGRVVSVRGSVRAVRGPDTNPAQAGGMPLGTVGAFVITRAS
jgi:hypothetical protein